jgi:probable rRNA maturation factor
MAMEINVLIEEGIEVQLESDWLQSIVEKTLTAENLPPNAEISLVITGQERIRELNRQFRGLDRPTDVLSFAMSEQTEEKPEAFIKPPDSQLHSGTDVITSPLFEAFIGPPDGMLHLGEVIISYPQAVIQAEERGHSIKKEMVILIVHGVLHILGYDHEKPDREPAMTAREKEVLSTFGKELI